MRQFPIQSNGRNTKGPHIYLMIAHLHSKMAACARIVDHDGDPPIITSNLHTVMPTTPLIHVGAHLSASSILDSSEAHKPFIGRPSLLINPYSSTSTSRQHPQQCELPSHSPFLASILHANGRELNISCMCSANLFCITGFSAAMQGNFLRCGVVWFGLVLGGCTVYYV